MSTTSDHQITDLLHHMRTGSMGAEHSPGHVADIIEQLWRERRAAESRLRELENVATLTGTGAALRTAYGKGYQDAVAAAMERVPPNVAAALASLRPDFNRASQLVAGD